LAVVVPAFNAARHLGAVLDRLLAIVPPGDVCVVDDGSFDATADVARRRGVRVARQAPNQGKGAALRRGFLETAGYDWVATLDADGQHDPADLPRLLEAAAEADLVVGHRALGGRMPAHRRIGNRASSWIIGALAGQPIADSQSGYRLHSRRLLDSVLPRIRGTGGYVFETEILVRAARQGFKLAGVPIATVYADEQSHFRPLRELPRFVALFGRLLLAVASGDAARRPTEAERRRAAAEAPGARGPRAESP
jgi:glycosyltransferase involved in cell wall biosynthesis